MALSFVTTVLLCGLAILVFRLSRRTQMPQGLCLPPGPKPKPIIGNMLDIPNDSE
ncbi:hypothetical protein M422DRAFT_251938 [Sphaerobolus stellatus SS14]|uniref:Uncharacterized protein n=1 Tax=Sphaerobolus stellatus (strain SS14) TaxID=990650 RepID=A0A0C9VQN0_SPHS4|nr:hypothetical protein M422DRAFT_251938 [Sphaerobolus stellatus SS14]